MARRRDHRRWHIGDSVQVPWYRVTPGHRGEIGGWQDATVVAVRGERVIARQFSWETEYPSWLVQPPRVHTGLWQRWWCHDKRRDRISR